MNTQTKCFHLLQQSLWLFSYYGYSRIHCGGKTVRLLSDSVLEALIGWQVLTGKFCYFKLCLCICVCQTLDLFQEPEACDICYDSAGEPIFDLKTLKRTLKFLKTMSQCLRVSH